MKKQTLRLALAATALFGLAAFATSPKAPPPVKYEYKWVVVDQVKASGSATPKDQAVLDQLDTEFNRLGNLGWSIASPVSAVIWPDGTTKFCKPVVPGGGEGLTAILFKRVK